MKTSSTEIKYLHISRKARDKYQTDQTLFSKTGNAIFTNFHAVRNFVQQMNKKRNVVEFPEKAVQAGEINGMGLIHEILHYVVERFQQEKKSDLFREAYAHLCHRFSREQIDHILEIFVNEFPPPAVYQNKLSAAEFLKQTTHRESHRHLMTEELVLLWLSNANPAFADYLELFDDESLEKNTAYPAIIVELRRFLERQPRFGPDNENLLDMLQAPAKAVPHSIPGQLEWIREHWGRLLDKYLYRLLHGLDLIKEETKMRPPGPGPAEEYRFLETELEYERFSKDLDWMPRVVLLAKNVYVWLDQLSKKYQKEIRTLDQIPDQELDQLAQQGFTGLWLIGIWERSQASRKIKQMMGNPEAVASAYSLYDYIVAADLGGESAYQSLRQRARQRGVRMSGDMVPNHVGIDGKWVIEHPDWFIGLEYSPYPAYTFNGPDVCDDDRVGIYIEDHYYERSDAAVVFKRVDHHTGDTKYIYHGNDGTSMPWNDTAQLNYLKKEVREAVINTILHVARQFDIIRFDAAMTLAKKHYQRLWFPQPGSGGDIPSRAEHSVSKADFDRLFPQEFWREVVDRVADEEPDTLLLAEAFWLMEGYFVRTLGMHRVYNSAFMNMLKNEDNAKYRQTIKNVLEFNPEILKRFVNFMNNPDEETAIAQFGRDDKYFGTCAMLATLPGLPMFGHGQIEGYQEKYGMEYKRAYWDETPDPDLIRRHEKEIFPLLHKRYLFADVVNFWLYDFYVSAGQVNENVFAYSNRYGDERALVIYNNKFQQTTGWIKSSAACARKTAPDAEPRLERLELAQALNLPDATDQYCIFRDHVSGLEYIRNCHALLADGLYVALGAFKYQVFLDFRVVPDEDHQYQELAAFLDGRGVPSVVEAQQELLLQPLRNALRRVLNQDRFEQLLRVSTPDTKKKEQDTLLQALKEDYTRFLHKIKQFTGAPYPVKPITDDVYELLKLECNLSQVRSSLPVEETQQSAFVKAFLQDKRKARAIGYIWTFIHPLGKLMAETDYASQSRSWIDGLFLGKLITEFCRAIGLDEDQSNYVLNLVEVLALYQDWWEQLVRQEVSIYNLVRNLLQRADIRHFIRVNRYREVLWFNRERLEELLQWLRFIGILKTLQDQSLSTADRHSRLKVISNVLAQIQSAKQKSNYQVDKLLSALQNS